MTRAALTMLAALSACSTLPDEPAHTCGNGVIDPGEDCDGSPRCMQCQLTCPDGACIDATGAALPGYTCGIDKVCHAPSGVFHPTESNEFPFTPLGEVVTDIDADGIGDVVGTTQDTEVVHFGDPAGQLARNVTAIIPSASGLPAFAPLDADPSQDLIVPTPDGLAAMTSPSHIPLPFPFANNTANRAECVTMMGTADAIGVAPLDDTHMATVVADRTTHQVYLGVLDIKNETCAAAPACTLTNPQFPGTIGITRYLTNQATPGNLSAVVVLDDHSSQYCVMRLTQSGSSFTIEQLVARSWQPIAPAEQPVLARLDATTPCPSLVIGNGSGGLVRFAPVQTASGCTLAASSSALASPAGGPFAPALGVPLNPPIAGYAPDALVLDSFPTAFPQSSIYAYPASGAPLLLYASNDAFTEIHTADLDGNGVDELVAAPQLATDLKILYRAANDTYLLDRVPTAGTPSNIVLGDYDANGIADIAYIDALAQGSQLMVAYGTPDRPLPAVPAASFDNRVFAVLPTEVADSIDPSEQAQDLVVLQSDNTGDTAGITVLHGSAQRTLFAFYDPRDQVTAQQTLFSTVAGGHFFGHSTTDVLAFQAPQSGIPTTGCPVRVWELQGAGAGALANAPSPLDVCNSASVPEIGFPCGTKLCGSSAKLVAYPLADHDVAIGIDNQHHLVTLDPQQASATSQPVIASSAAPSLAQDLVVDRVAVADLDGDGKPELIVPYRQQSPVATERAVTMVCETDAAGVVSSCSDIRDLVGGALDGLDCVDARPGHATPRGRLDVFAQATMPDLAVSCFGNGGGVFLVSHASGSYVAKKILDFPAYFLDLADVTGDGVDDLLVLSFAMESTLHVYPQCEARDLACQGLQ